MIAIFRVLFPTIALFYFLIKGAKCKLFFLGIPFVIYMGNSVMFSKHLTRIFNRPGIDSDFKLFFWLFIVWVICKKPYRKYVKNVYSEQIRFGESFIYLILAFVAVHIFVALTQSGSFLIIYYNAREPIFMVLGYFMIKQILLSFSPEKVNQFCKSLIGLSAISILIFVLHQGLGIKIYPYAEYTTFTYLQLEMTRTFTIMNPFLLAIYAYSLVTVSVKRSSVFLLILAVSAIAVSYTRGLVLVAIVMILGYTISNIYKNRSIKKAMIHLAIPLVIVGIGLITFKLIMPERFEFLGSRISEVTDSFSEYDDNTLGSISRVSTVDTRNNQMNVLFTEASTLQKIYGNGYSQEMAGNSQLIIGIDDSEWQLLFIQFGILGMLLFSIIQGIFLVLAIRIGKLAYSEKAIYGIVIALVIIGNFVHGFTSPTLFSYHGVALSFWPYAFLVSKAQRNNQTLFAINGFSENNTN